MKQKLGFTLSAIATLLCSQSFMAQAADTGFFASVDTTLAHDDNIYRVTDDLAKSDSYLNIKPTAELIGGLGKQRFELSYKGDYAKFANQQDADFSDHYLRGRIFLDHTTKFKTQFEANYQKEHEEPGVIQRVQLDITEYNKFSQNFVGAGFSYGQESSIGQITFNYGRYDRDYTNNGLDYLDFVNNQFIGRFDYRLAPKTRIYIEGMVADFDYAKGQTFELDNKYTRYRTGITWDFTNKLSGDINIGYQDRDYSQENLQDISGLAYSANVDWAINTYTELGVVAVRESVDSSLEESGGFLRTTYGVELSHALTELWRAKMSAYYTNDELVFTSSREDERYSYNLTLDYNLSRLVKIGANYIYEERDSTDSIANFKANIIGLTVTVSLEN